MKKKMIFIAILLTIMSISVIYYNYTQTTKNIENNIKNEEILNQSYAKITINGEEILFFKHTPNDEPINLETLNIEYDTILNIETKDAEVKIGDKIIENIEYNIGKIKISNKNKIILHIKFLGEEEYKKYEINTLPSDFFQYELEGEPNENEEYYITFYDKVSSNSNYYIFKMNSKGEVTFFKKMSYYNNAFNFKKQIINDKTRYTYLETSNFEYEGLISSLPATLVVLNEKYEKINEIMYDKEKEIYADNHDYVYLDDNHYIICGYTKETVNNFPGSENKSIWNCRIKEVKDDKILWEFESVKNKELYEYSNEVYNSDNAFDYMRFNSMDIDPNDGNLICSFREIDAIIKISRTNGKIIWVLGGKGDQFGLTEEQKLHNLEHVVMNPFLKSYCC